MSSTNMSRSSGENNRAPEKVVAAALALLKASTSVEVWPLIAVAMQALGFDRVRLYRLSDDGQCLVGQGQAGMDNSFVGWELALKSDDYIHAILAAQGPCLFSRQGGEPWPYEEKLGKEDVDEWVGVALRIRDEIIGMITADNKASQATLTAEQLGLLAIFAAEASAAIENVRLQEQAQEAQQLAEWRARTLEAIQHVAALVASRQDLERICRLTCRAAKRLFGMDHSGLVLFGPDSATGTVLAEYPNFGTKGLEIPLRGLPAEEELIGSQMPLVLNDVDARPDLGPVLDIFHRFDICSILIVPLVANGRVLGSFSVETIGRRHLFTDEEIELGRLLAVQVASAVENAQLFADNSKRVRQLEQLSQISNEIMSNLGHVHLDDMFQLIAQHGAEILGTEGCGICLITRPNILTLKADYGYLYRPSDEGREFIIQSGPGTGLTGHIAYMGELFNVYGEALVGHPARKGDEPPALPSGECYSLLAMPLWSSYDSDRKLLGLLRAENKMNEDGRPDARLRFTAEDEWLIQLLANVVVVAIQRAKLFDRISQEKDHTSRLIASAPDGVIAIDGHGRITAYNSQAEAILGYTFEEVRGQRVDLLYAQLDEPVRIGDLLRNSPDGKLLNYETAVRSKPGKPYPDGEIIPIRLDATWLLDAAGNQVGSVGYFQDLRAIRRDIEHRLALLLEAGNLVAQAESLDEALSQLAGLLVKQLNVSFAHVFLMDEDGEVLQPGVVHSAAGREGEANSGSEPDSPILPAKWPRLAALLAGGGPELVGLPEPLGQIHLGEWQRCLGLSADLQSLFLIPLRVRDQAVGLLCLGDQRPLPQVPFSDTQTELATAIAEQTAVLIDKIQLLEETARHRELLRALDIATRSIRAEKQTDKLLQEVVRLAADQFGRDASGLFEHNPHLGVLKLIEAHNLPVEWIGRHIPLGLDLISSVARTGEADEKLNYSLWVGDEEEVVLCARLVALPLKLAGDVAAVLAVADTERHIRRPFRRADLDILKRFTFQAALALRASQLLNQEQRTYRLLDNLHKISNYIQTTSDMDKILLAVLTGITAGYGLGFNRAALFLLDEATDHLVCRAAVGHVNEREAFDDWEESHASGLFDIASALDYLNQGRLKPTPLHDRIHGLPLPARPESGDAFSRAMAQGHCLPITGEEVATLPEPFLHAFVPAPSLVVAPLMARGQAVGLIVADNKFTRAPITDEDMGLLFTYANTAAIAIENIRRVEKQDDMRQAADALAGAVGLADVLNLIVHRAQQVLEADWTAFWSFDEAHGKFILENSVTAGIPPDVWDVFRQQEPQPGQTAFTVIECGWVGVGDVSDSEQYPFLSVGTRQLLGQIGARSFQGIALTADDERLGVLYVNYSRPRTFSTEAKATAQAFANHAALALQKARLMEQLGKIRNTARVVARVTTSADLDETLRSVVKGTQDAMRCDAVTLYVYDAGRDRLRYPPTVTGVWNEEGVRQETAVPENSLVLKMLRRANITIVDKVADEPLLEHSRFTIEERIASLAAVPLKVGQSQVGVMFINYRTEHRFTGDEKENIELFADQAALAIHDAQLSEQSESRAEAVQALYEVGKMLTDTHELNKILAVVAEQAWRLNREAYYCSVSLIRNNRLAPVATYPPEILPHIKAFLNERDLDGEANLGVTGRAFKTGEMQLIPDVSKDDDYLSFGPPEGSELAVPIKTDDRSIGVIYVKHPDKNAFHDEDQYIIEALADQSGVAITIANQFTELEQTNIELERTNNELESNKKRLASAMAKRLTDTLARTWGHFVARRVDHTAELLEDIRKLLDVVQNALGADASLRMIASKLDYIKQNVVDIQRIPIFRLFPEKDVKSISINWLISHYMNQYGQEGMRYGTIPFDVSCTTAPDITVRVSPEWMCRVIEIVVENAVEAMRSSLVKRLTIRTRQVNQDVHILVTDTGKGIPASIQRRLFDEPILKRKRARGSGIGLVLAYMIVQAYGGTMFIDRTNSSGTTIAISLPIESS